MRNRALVNTALGLLSLTTLLVAPTPAAAAVPAVLNVQGVLRDPIGDPVDGTFSLTFALYDAPSDGNELWLETQADVPVGVGVFSALLGAAPENPLPVQAFATAAEVWVEVQVGAELPLPRQRLVSAAYAFEAQHAVLADAAAALDCEGCVATEQLDFDPATQDELDALAQNPLGSLSCALGYGLAFDGSAWACTPLAQGDVTGIAVDAGLCGGGDSGDVSLGICLGGVSELLLADGAVTGPKLAADSVESAHVANGSLTDDDISPTAAIAQSKIAGVIGDVTGVSAGSGLSGGGDSGDLTLTLVSCLSGELLQSDGTNWACTSQVYDSERLAGLTEAAYFRLSDDETVTGTPTFTGVPAFNGGTTGSTAPFAVDSATLVTNLNAEFLGGKRAEEWGLGTPSQVPRANTLTTVVSTGSVGVASSLTIGADGLPVIAYYDDTTHDTKVVRCGNAACSAGNTFGALDAGFPWAGFYNAIAIGADGLPVIAYLEASNGDLSVAKCGNAACSAGNTVTAVDTAGITGHQASIVIGTDGLPVVSYLDYTNNDLRVAKCGNAACSEGNTLTTVDSTGMVGNYSSIAMGVDGLPVIAYMDRTNQDLKVAKCGNAACSAGNTLTTVDTTGWVGFYTSITIGADGLPIVSYLDQGNSALKVAKCGNSACSAGNTLTTVDPALANVISHRTSITVGPDGLPLIAYEDTALDLKVAKCGNAACSAGNTIVTVDAAGDVGQNPSVTIAPDGLPVISYYDVTNLDLKVAKCANPFCLPYWTRR